MSSQRPCAEKASCASCANQQESRMKIRRFILRSFASLMIVSSMLSLRAQSNVLAGGWTTLGALGVPTWENGVLLFHGAQGTLALTPLSDDVVRVRFTRKSELGRDHSYAVVSRDLGAARAKAELKP